MDLPQFVHIADLHRDVIQTQIPGWPGIFPGLEQREVMVNLAAGQKRAARAPDGDLKSQYFGVEPLRHGEVPDIEDDVPDALGLNHWSLSVRFGHFSIISRHGTVFDRVSRLGALTGKPATP